MLLPVTWVPSYNEVENIILTLLLPEHLLSKIKNNMYYMKAYNFVENQAMNVIHYEYAVINFKMHKRPLTMMHASR